MTASLGQTDDAVVGNRTVAQVLAGAEARYGHLRATSSRASVALLATGGTLNEQVHDLAAVVGHQPADHRQWLGAGVLAGARAASAP